MRALSASQFDSWERSRKQGRPKFIAQRGILRLGIPAGLAFGLVFALSRPADLAVHVVSITITTAAVALIGGSLWGLIIWNSTEQRFLSTLKTKEEDNALRQTT
jgi:hypothetical protein